MLYFPNSIPILAVLKTVSKEYTIISISDHSPQFKAALAKLSA
jgi:hypothetical protein